MPDRILLVICLGILRYGRRVAEIHRPSKATEELIAISCVVVLSVPSSIELLSRTVAIKCETGCLTALCLFV